MKKTRIKFIVFFFIVIIIPIILFQGCSMKGFGIRDKIVAPKNKLIPITGEWQVEKYKILNSSEKKYQEPQVKPGSIVGQKAAFDTEYAVFGQETCENPQYKIKEVDAKNYFFYTYKVNSKDFDVTTKNLEVISITSDGRLFYDLIKLSDKEILVYSDDAFYYLKKISEESENILNKDNVKKLEDNKKKDLSKNKGTLRSGVLIGLRSPIPLEYNGVTGEAYENKSIFYRTLWISTKNREPNSIIETPNLFFPRISGFWWAGINRTNNNPKYPKDSLFAYPAGNSKENTKLNENNYSKDDALRRILFIGNDYVATEYKKASSFSDDEGKSILQVLPIDNVGDMKGIKISDVAGERGRAALKNSAEAFLASQDKDIAKRLEKSPREESFTLIRRNGHWIMSGRLNSNSAEDVAYGDFNINIVPPTKLLNYDDFHISWNDIKGTVPDAVDAYTSPNKDIAIIVSKNFIYVYSIENGQLSNKQLEKIPIHEGESVVMAEWATGDYVERWEKALKSNKVLH
ncbi:hypothetical protein CLLI_19920 [Clostridium liquoris]|uniref:Lipoprotein n=1 Tax=Clostridium liquoris TaxID=1289519 RepID=A0A2T0B2F8_9CLOT|nr:hypothetical protein [Clostridium liquoris]PRR78072.1 hypothetical protein CLLI_19920 [Clostridium liquoris]